MPTEVCVQNNTERIVTGSRKDLGNNIDAGYNYCGQNGLEVDFYGKILFTVSRFQS